MKKKILFISLLSIILLVAAAFILFKISNSRTFQFFGELIARVETQEKVIALTFDDGPTPQTQEVLDILKQKNAKATFYMIGENMDKYPEIATSVVAEGHELGNHSYTHQRFYFKSQSFIDEEIQKTSKTIRDAGYNGEITFRPPYGKKLFGLPWYLEQQKMKTIMWDVEPETYINTQTGDARREFLINYTIENTKPGSIILLHPFCDSCELEREAVEQIIDRLQKDGYTFVTVSELLTSQN